MELRSGAQVGRAQDKGLLPNPQSQAAFEEGVKHLFRRWTALNLAVENQWGGANSAEKANWLVEDTIEWFRINKEHYWDDLEEMLSEALSDDFNMEAQDGSPEEVSKVLVELYQQCARDDYSSVFRWRADADRAGAGARASRQQVVDRDGTMMDESGDDDSSSDDDPAGDQGPAGPHTHAQAGAMMDHDAGPPQAVLIRQEPVVDEDGFTLVQSGKGRRGQGVRR